MVRKRMKPENQEQRGSERVGAYKKHDGRKYFFDMTNIKADYTFLHANAKARQKHRELKRLDPYAHCIGAYRKYKTPEALQRHIDGYFRSCMSPLRNKMGDLVLDEKGHKIMVQTKPYTLSGMASHLGITTRTLTTYKTKALAGLIPPEYADIVIMARQKIEEYAESQLYSRDGNRGGEFVLRAGFGWRTKSERTADKISKKRQKLQENETKLKHKMLQEGLDEDGKIEIKITRASKRQGEQDEEED